MAYNKVVLNGKTLIDLTEDTVTDVNLGYSQTAHNAQGNQIVGKVILPDDPIFTNLHIGSTVPDPNSLTYWLPLDKSYEIIEQKNIAPRTMTIDIPAMASRSSGYFTIYAPAHANDINQCLGYGITRNYTNNQALFGIAQINKDGSTKVLIDNYVMATSNSYKAYIQGAIDTPEYLYILTGYGNSNSSYRTTVDLQCFNKNTHTFTTINLLSAQYSISCSLKVLGEEVFVFIRHNASSTSSSSTSWYYDIFKSFFGSTTAAKIYSLNKYQNVASPFIYQNQFYSFLQDSDTAGLYAIFNSEGTIVDHWSYKTNMPTGSPTVVNEDWLIYLKYQNFGGRYIYFYQGYNFATEELITVASGLTDLETTYPTIDGNELISYYSGTFYFYPLIASPREKNTLVLVQDILTATQTYDQPTARFLQSKGIYDAYHVSTTNEITACGLYKYDNGYWTILNGVTRNKILSFAVNDQYYCYSIPSVTWHEYIQSLKSNNPYIIDENTQQIYLDNKNLCLITEVGYQYVLASDLIVPGGHYIDMVTTNQYNVINNISNVIVENISTSISDIETLTYNLEAAAGYKLKPSFEIKNANYIWNEDNQKLLIGSPTGDVEINIINEELYEHKNVVGLNAVYYRGVTSTSVGSYTGATEIYYQGHDFPTTVLKGDVYVHNGYEYRYNYYFGGSSWSLDNNQLGWGVRPIDATKVSYSDILSAINGINIVSMTRTFYNCTSLIKAPNLPAHVKYLTSAFYGCTALTTAPSFIGCDSVTSMKATFDRCAALKTYQYNSNEEGNFSSYIIPSTVTTTQSLFSGCKLITHAPSFADCTSLTTMEGTFYECSGLTNIDNINIPSLVINVSYLFYYCTTLAGTFKLDITPTTYKYCLYKTKITNIEGTCENKSAILATK